MLRFRAFFFLSFAACSGRTEREPGDTARPAVVEATRPAGVDALAQSANPDLRRRADAMNRERDSVGLELMFYVRGDSAPAERPGFTFEEAPCGFTMLGRFRQIPLRDSVILADPVVEFDLSGKPVREWAIPTTHTMVGIEGSEIIAGMNWGPDENRVMMLAVDTSGRYRVLPRVPLVVGRGIPCPALAPLPESAYRQCAVFPDARDKTERRIAYEGQCS
jgi:hypothetical protein